MPDHVPLTRGTGVSITKSRHLLGGAAEVAFEIAAAPGSAVAAALLANTPFPAGKIELGSASITVTGGRSLALGGSGGTVTFDGEASAYQRLAVLDEPADVTSLLVRDSVNDDLAEGLALERIANHRYVLLRWGYDTQGSGKGSVALGVGPKVTFGAEGKRLGAYAVITQIPDSLGAATALERVFQSWMLPSQFQKLDDLEPGTWIVAEVDGSIALTLGTQYGYDFNWVREAVEVGGLAGDIGLKVQVGVSATLGFEASGQYAIALGRPVGSRQLRLQLFRLNRNGLSLAYSAGVTSQGSFGGVLPDHFDEFIAGVFGLHGLQVLKELEKWTSPDQKLSDLVAGVGVAHAEEFLGKVTGLDAKTEFNAARDRLVSLLEAWHALPHRVATTVYSAVQNEVSGLPQLKAQLARVAAKDLAEFRPELETLLSHVDFFKTPFGTWLEAAAVTSVLSAANDTAEYARVQQLATQTLAVLDGSVLESTLVRLQGELARRIGLGTIEQIVDETTFAKADEWLKARLAAFLGKAVDLAQVQDIRAAIHRLFDLRQAFFTQAKAALTRKYEFQILGSYQQATTRTALIDVVFDFDAPGASAAQLTTLAVAAIDGDFDQVIVRDIAGVSLRQAVLTHDVTRQSHLEVTLPFLHVTMDHINNSLARMESVQAEGGRLLVYDLHAEDLTSAKGRFASRFAVHGRFAQQGGTRVFDDRALTHSYTFRQAVPAMRRRALEAQLKPYVDTYFRSTFGAGDASFITWITDLDRTIDKLLHNGPDNFGNTLLSLEVRAPSELVGAWALAPDKAKAAPYFAMSKGIQKQLRALIPLTYFGELANFRHRVPSAALLVYASLPTTNDIIVENGRIVRFDDTRDVYPDIDSSGHVEALARNSRTVASLMARIATVHDVLLDTDGLRSVAADYHPNDLDRVINDALTPNGRGDLGALLKTERQVVREAHAAGLQIAAFLKAKSASKAVEALSGYGAKVTSAFNARIGGLFSGRELRPLGTLVFLEAARAFDPGLESRQSSALLELTVLKDTPSFDMRSFVEGAEVPAADVLDVQKFVALA